MNSETPFAHIQTSAQAGFEAAQRDLEAALHQINTLPVRERKGFIVGIFTFVGKRYSPAEALAIYNRQAPGTRPYALRALTVEWISSRSTLDEDARYRLQERIWAVSSGKLGLEVELTKLCSTRSKTQRNAKRRWWPWESP